ncbi:glycosyltransferase family 4 protein [Magnetospirillum molischianum]|nr:glycosyltransferase family 4 protein [Magnetospirillum molischianum]
MIHDYVGHPFQAQLSRWLARQGHDVLHCHCADFETPHGALAPRPDDPSGLVFRALGLGRPLPKYSPVRRWLHERRYADQVVACLAAFAPDAVISANTPPAIQSALLRRTHQGGARFVSWLQDIISLAADKALRERLPVIGGLAAAVVRRQEFQTLAASDAVVAITADFVPLCIAGGVRPERIQVIPNWAPLDEMPSMPSNNCWRSRHGLDGKTVVLYSGTLGLKHNPGLLAALARACRMRSDVVVVVVTQGLGRRWLEVAKAEQRLDNLLLLDFQPYEELPLMLAAADVLVAILEPYAGVLSVPSKVLTYLCAGRPILGAMPPENLAARTIVEAGAGMVVASTDEDAFAAAALALLNDPARCQIMGRAARDWAEHHFDIDAIGPGFLDVVCHHR